MARLIKRGEVWITDLRPTIGWEVAKKRPAIIISIDQINDISPVVVIIPLSSRVPKILGPERILIPSQRANLKKDSVVLTTQIRAIDKKRLIKKIGYISGDLLKEIEGSLKLVLGMTELD